MSVSAPGTAEPGSPKEGRPQLLFLCHTLPYPLDAGVWLRTFNLLRQLSTEFRIKMLCFERAVPGGQRAPDVAHARRELEKFAEVEVFEVPEMRSRLQAIAVHMRSVLHRRVFTVYRYANARFDRALEKALEGNTFDLVHLDSLDLSGFLPIASSAPVVCVHHNVESKLLARRGARERGLKARYIRLQSSLQAAEERRWCGTFALNIMVSDGDASDLREIVPEARCCVVPNGVDPDYFTASGPGFEKRIAFVGGLNWYPNRDGLDYFSSEILPLVQREHPDVQVDWIGAGAHLVDAARMRAAGIRLLGRVEDIRPIVAKSRCFVVPLRVGGGSRLKILDAWALGRAVVSTSVGCEGLATEDGVNILIADSREDFARAVCRLLEDESLARELGQNGRETVERNYSWSTIGKEMNARYLELAQQRQ